MFLVCFLSIVANSMKVVVVDSTMDTLKPDHVLYHVSQISYYISTTRWTRNSIFSSFDLI